MKWLRVSVFIVASCVILMGTKASALGAAPFEPTPRMPDSPIVIAAYSLTSTGPGYVELFNSSAQPIDLQGWKLEYVSANENSPTLLAQFDGWIAPANYVIAADITAVNNADFSYRLSGDVLTPKSLRLVPPGSFSSSELAISKVGLYQRKISSTTGDYLSTFEAITAPLLYSGGFYSFPDSSALQFSEILANPRICSPLETSLDCGDYVKLYNPSQAPIDLSMFRLRVGYKGQTASSSNTYELTGIIQPGHFVTITNDSGGRPISITNSGGFVWLEDTYGIVRYDSTVQAYEDASADSKKGQAWAYDVRNGAWRWTTQPSPADAPSTFPPVVTDKPSVTSAKVYSSCKTGEYRNEKTHRCRTLAVTTALKSCLANQYRSPETNRCRNLATATTSSLKPCEAGQERNPETSRCRKSSSDVPKSAFSVEPVTDTSKAFAGWWALGGMGTLAAGYGVWEWRREAMGGIRKIGTFFTSSK